MQTYQPKVYKDQGGNRQVVESGGTILAKAGAVVDLSAATRQASTGIGALAGSPPTGLAVTETEPNMHRTQITLVNTPVTMTDQGTNGNQGHIELYDLPAGLINVLGAECGLSIASSGTPGLSTSAAVVASVGSAPAATTDATLTGTEANVIPSTTAPLTTYAGTFAGRSTGSCLLDSTQSPAVGFTGTAQKLYLNFACPHTNSSGNDTLTVNGTIDIVWLNHGNH